MLSNRYTCQCKGTGEERRGICAASPGDAAEIFIRGAYEQDIDQGQIFCVTVITPDGKTANIQVDIDVSYTYTARVVE